MNWKTKEERIVKALSLMIEAERTLQKLSKNKKKNGSQVRVAWDRLMRAQQKYYKCWGL